LYLLLAVVLLVLIYLLHNLGSTRNLQQRHHIEHNEEFLKMVQETKRNRERLEQKPFEAHLFDKVVLHNVLCACTVCAK